MTLKNVLYHSLDDFLLKCSLAAISAVMQLIYTTFTTHGQL